MNAINTRFLFPVLANNTPSGGRKFIYHTVDMLNKEGIEAWVVHPNDGFRLSWFDNKTQVGAMIELFPSLSARHWKRTLKFWQKYIINKYILKTNPPSSKRLELRKTDILILPEQRLRQLHLYPSECKKIIFNQNPYFTFSSQFFMDHQPIQDFFGKDILGMVVVSKLNLKIQKYVFPRLDVVRGKLFIENKFNYQSVKKRQIAYMPRRNENDALAVLNMLRFRGLDREVKIIPIDNMSQTEVVKVLSDSLIFLSFAEREGFGLPAAEAMACGCVVIGYSGNGGDEFFDPEYCFPIREGDLEGFVRTVEEVLRMNRTGSEELDLIRERASATIRKHYSHEESKRTMVAAFRKLLDS